MHAIILDGEPRELSPSEPFVDANLLSLDMLANTLLDGRVGDTISARCGRAMALGLYRLPHWPRWWVAHCYWAAGLPLPGDTAP